MKKSLLVISFAFIFIKNVGAQEMFTTPEALEKLLTSTLYVPITENKVLDKAIEQAFSKYWNVSSYKLIDSKEYIKLLKENEKQKRSELSKNVLFRWSVNYISVGEVCAANTFSRGTEALMESHWLSDGTGSFITSKSFDYIVYRLEYIIKGMNDMILYTKDNSLAGNKAGKVSPDINKKIIEHINTQAKMIKDKTLILNRDMKLGMRDVYKEKSFSKEYPYPHKFVSEKEFNEILKSEQKEYVCFVPTYNWVGTGDSEHCEAIEYVYEPATKSIIYVGNIHRFGVVQHKDAKMLVQQIK